MDDPRDGIIGRDRDRVANWPALHVEELFKVQYLNGTYHYLNLFSYIHTLGVLCAAFIVTGECYRLASGQVTIKELFRIDLATTYTKASALTLYYALQLIIGLLVVGLIMYPICYFAADPYIRFSNQSVFTFAATLLAGLLCIIFAIRFYRKFILEYFMSIQKPVSWLYWIVNIPIIGLLAFPFVVFTANPRGTVEERTAFYDQCEQEQRPTKIMVVMLVLNLLAQLIKAGLTGSSETDWLLWLVEVALFIWFATAISGYYVLLVLCSLCYVAYLVLVFKNVDSLNKQRTLLPWLTVLFTMVQYPVLLPLFHLYKIRKTARN